MGLFNRKGKKAAQSKDEGQDEEGLTRLEKFMRKPANTSFRQQRLKAWQPILTPKTVLPTFFVIGILFAPIGGLLLWGSDKVKEFTIDYTRCEFDATGTASNIPSNKYTYHVGGSAPSAPTWEYIEDSSNANVALRRICRITFDVPETLSAPVFQYYKLTNYYQNHRRYTKSFSSDQLKGQAVDYGTIQGSECKPLDVRDGKIVYPCGLIANSVFNDTYSQPILLNPSNGASTQTYNMTEQGIVWSGEPDKYGATQYSPDQIVPPPYWVERYGTEYTTESGLPNLHEDEHFQVWMRIAGLPTFRKLWQRNPNEDMVAGTYTMDIALNYPVNNFGGTKSIVFSTVSWIGGRNPFLGIAYLVVAGICILIGLGLTLRHLLRPRRLGDLTYLSWNNAKKDSAHPTPIATR